MSEGDQSQGGGAPLPLARGVARAGLATLIGSGLSLYLGWLYLIALQREFLRRAPAELVLRGALGVVLWCGLLALAANLARSARAARPVVLAGAGLLTPFLLWLAQAWIGGLVSGGPQGAWRLLPSLLDEGANVPVVVWVALASPTSAALVGLAACYAYRPPRSLRVELMLAVGWALVGYLLLQGLLATIFGFLFRAEVGHALPRSLNREPWLWLLFFLLVGLCAGLGLAVGRRLEERLASRWPWLGGDQVMENPPPPISRRLLVAVPGALALPALLIFGSWFSNTAGVDAEEAEVFRNLAAQGFAVTPEALERAPKRNAKELLEEAFGVLGKLNADEVQVIELESWRLQEDVQEEYFPSAIHTLHQTQGPATYAKLDALPELIARATDCDGWSVPVDWSNQRANRPHLSRLPLVFVALSLRALQELDAGRLASGWRQIMVLGRLAGMLDEATLSAHRQRNVGLASFARAVAAALRYGPPPADLGPELHALLRRLEDSAGLSRPLRGELLLISRSDSSAFAAYLGLRRRAAYSRVVPEFGQLNDTVGLRRSFLRSLERAIPLLTEVSKQRLDTLERLQRHESRGPEDPVELTREELTAVALLRCARGLLEEVSGAKGPLPLDPYTDQPLRRKRDGELLWLWSVGRDGMDDGGRDRAREWTDDVLLEVRPPGRVIPAGGE